MISIPVSCFHAFLVFHFVIDIWNQRISHENLSISVGFGRYCSREDSVGVLLPNIILSSHYNHPISVGFGRYWLREALFGLTTKYYLSVGSILAGYWSREAPFGLTTKYYLGIGNILAFTYILAVSVDGKNDMFGFCPWNADQHLKWWF